MPGLTAPAGSEGRQVVCGIRPEHFRLASEGLAVRVVIIEPTGSETLVFVRTGGLELTCVFRERVEFKVGDTIHIDCDPALVHLFDSASGLRVN